MVREERSDGLVSDAIDESTQTFGRTDNTCKEYSQCTQMLLCPGFLRLRHTEGCTKLMTDWGSAAPDATAVCYEPYLQRLCLWRPTWLLSTHQHGKIQLLHQLVQTQDTCRLIINIRHWDKKHGYTRAIICHLKCLGGNLSGLVCVGFRQ